MALRALLICTFLSLSACTEEAQSYRYRGTGTELYTSQTSQDTQNLLRYLTELCAQSGQYQNSEDGYTCNPTVQYKLLMHAGFNDIDTRCNRYLTWIDSERTRRLAYRNGLSATQTLLAGALGISGASADTLAYLALAFGFAGSFHDAVTTSMMMNLESSTIKTIVYKRRQAFREAAQRTSIDTQPELIYALRNYLNICTPQTIVLDVNTFSRSALTGTRVDVKAQAQEQFRALGPLSASAPATKPGTPVPPPKGNCPDCAAIFENSSNRSQPQFQSAQTLLCVGTDASTEETVAAVEFSEKTGLFPSNRNGKLSDGEFRDLAVVGCEAKDVEFLNIWEKDKLQSEAIRKVLIGRLNKLDPAATPIPETASLNDLRLRAAIGKFARENNLAGTAPGPSQMSEQIWESLIFATQ